MKTWHDVLGEEKQKPYFQQILQQVKQERLSGKAIYPPSNEVFKAFELTPFAQIKVVILGQDPYHQPNQAHGLAFSVKENVAIPPSLLNIYKELSTEYPDFSIPVHGNLTKWAEQGVFLLNTVLTVRDSQPNSHQLLGWERFTDCVIDALNREREHLVFLLWGNNAKRKGTLIDKNRHNVLTAAHPSPLSAYRGFFGCDHFRQANAYLCKQGLTPIDWQL